MGKVGRYIPPRAGSPWRKDTLCAVPITPYDIGRLQRLHNMPYDRDRFFLDYEQAEYHEGYSQEQADLRSYLTHIGHRGGKDDYGSS